MLLKKKFLCCFLLQNIVAIAMEQKLPLPFCYFENLYFEPIPPTFLSDIDPVIDIKRGYFFKNSEKPDEHIKKITGTTLFLFETEETKHYLTHFFHLLEHILGHWSYYGDQYFQDVHWIILASDGDENNLCEWEGPHQMNRHLLKALFPIAKVETWAEFLQRVQNKTVCFEKTMTSDRALAFYSAECNQINKMLAIARNTLSQDALQHLSDQIHFYAKTKIQQEEKFRITYLKRSPPRTLDPSIENDLFSSIEKLESISLRIEDFNTLSFVEQIQIIGNTDLLISVHGNGLSHTLFLPPTAKVIEIFPPATHALDYRLFAEARGLDYTGIIADYGVVEKEKAYQIGAFGNMDTGIQELDITPILLKIKTLWRREKP